jgi:hypothetical protein
MTSLPGISSAARAELDLLRFDPAPFVPLLQEGVWVDPGTDRRLGAILRRLFHLEPEEIRRKVGTAFVDGHPLDDLVGTRVAAGSCLSLSAPMPGLAGATLRAGSPLSSFRSAITHHAGETPSPGGEGPIRLKLFNLLIPDLGPRLLAAGVLIEAPRLRELLEALSAGGGRRPVLRLDGAPASPDTLPARGVPAAPIPLLLTVRVIGGESA